MEVREVKLSDIEVSDSNTRKDLEAGTEETGLSDLASSIQESGLLNPVIVRPKDSGKYDLIVGQRRFLACKRLGWNSIPAIIRDKMDDTDAIILSLVENVHRADMSPIDKARAYQRIYEKYSDRDRVARETGVSIPTIKRYLLLLDLAPSIQERLSSGDGPAGVGTLSRLAEAFDSAEKQEQVLSQIGGLNQQTQLEIIKRSGGDPDKIGRLREDALSGAFDMHICRGIDECAFIPDEIRLPVKQAIHQFKANGKKPSTDDIIRGAPHHLL